MKARGRGVIVNNIGTAGDQAPSGYAAGVTANGALVTLTRALGGTSLDDGIRVVGISPGDMENERGIMALKHHALKRFGDSDRWRELISGMPGGSLPVFTRTWPMPSSFSPAPGHVSSAAWCSPSTAACAHARRSSAAEEHIDTGLPGDEFGRIRASTLARRAAFLRIGAMLYLLGGICRVFCKRNRPNRTVNCVACRWTVLRNFVRQDHSLSGASPSTISSRCSQADGSLFRLAAIRLRQTPPRSMPSL